MSVQTLLAFSDAERERAFHLLAARVAYMMGRKFEEDDWSRVYCAAKGIPFQKWSNLNIDVMSRRATYHRHEHSPTHQRHPDP